MGLLANIPEELVSRKLAGLVLFLAFSLLVLLIWVVASILFDLPYEPFLGISGLGAQGATAHQAAQAAHDRAKEQASRPLQEQSLQVQLPVSPPPEPEYRPRIP